MSDQDVTVVGQEGIVTPTPETTPVVPATTPEATPTTTPEMPAVPVTTTPPAPEMTAEEVEQLIKRAAFYQTGYQKLSGALKEVAPDLQQRIKAELTKRYGGETEAATTPGEGGETTDVNDELGIGKIIDQRLSAREKQERIEILTQKLVDEQQQTDEAFMDFCSQGGYTQQEVQSVIASPAVQVIDQYQPGGYRLRGYVASLILDNQSLRQHAAKVAPLLERYKAEKEKSVSTVAQPAGAVVPSGTAILGAGAKAANDQRADEIARDTPYRRPTSFST